MSSFRNRRSLVPISLVMAVTMLVAAGPGSALADTSHGNIGAYSVHDTPTDPGLLCTYNADMSAIQSLTVRGPIIWNRDTTPEVDLRGVGWRFIVNMKLGSRVHKVYTSPWAFTNGSDQYGVQLPDVTVSPALKPTGHYFVVVKVFWVDRDGYPNAFAKHRILNNVRNTVGNATRVATPLCDGSYN